MFSPSTGVVSTYMETARERKEKGESAISDNVHSVHTPDVYWHHVSGRVNKMAKEK